MGIFRGSNGGIVLTSNGGLSSAAQADIAFLTQAPALPSTTKTVTWEAAGDPTSSPVTETTACWSDDGGTTTYNTLYAMLTAQSGDVTFNMPQGEFIVTSTVTNDTTHSFAFVAHASGTAMQANGASQDVFALNTTTATANLHLKNLVFGAFDAAISAHTFGVDAIGDLQKSRHATNFIQGGKFIIEGCEVRFFRDDGIYGANTNESVATNPTRDVGQYLLYNNEVYGCGDTGDEHGYYGHGVPTYMYRCWFHDAVAGHCVKYDGEMLILNECALANDWTASYSFAGAAPLNYTWPGDCITLNCFIYKQVDSSDRQVISVASRRNAGGRGWSKRLPPWWEQSTTTNQSRDIQWKNGGVGTTNDFYGARVSSYAAGTPSITVKNEAYMGSTTGSITNTTTSNYWRIDWGGETRLATKGDGTLVFTLASAFSGTPVSNDNLVIYPDSAGQDVPYLNEKMWNPNHVDYYWDQVIDTGALDLTAYAKYPLHLFEGTMFVQDIDTITNGRLYDIYAHFAEFYVASGPRMADLPIAPMSGESSTNTWSDAAYGSLDFGDAQNIFTGDEATSAVGVLPLLVGFADSSLILENGTTTQSGNVDVDGVNDSLATGMPIDPQIKYIASSSVNTVSNISTTNWFPTTADTTTSATAAVDATSITVASITGFSDGQTIHIEYDAIGAGVKPVYVGTINGAPSGSTITITPALERAVASGARVSAVTSAGTKPNWFMSIADVWNSRRVA